MRLYILTAGKPKTGLKPSGLKIMPNGHSVLNWQMNVFKNISWCVQLREPTLKVWVKKIEDRQKEKEKKEKILKMYEQGKLVPKKNCK